MKKTLLVVLFLTLSWSVQAKDKHEFYCDDSNQSAEPTQTPGRTHFTWTKNGTQIFNRTFTDAFSRSRGQYVTFHCQKNIIRYQLHDCAGDDQPFYCQNNGSIKPKLNVGQRQLLTPATLLDGQDYQLIARYVFSSLTDNSVYINGLYFVSDPENQAALTPTEIQAASQYEYVLMGPTAELVSGVTTNDGKLYFDLSSNPITITPTESNIGIAARPKSGLRATDNSSIRWQLNPALGAKGMVASSGGKTLVYDEIQLESSKPAVYSRGTSGLRIANTNIQSPILEPQAAAHSFFRFAIENLSDANPAMLRRGTLDMRLLGMQRTGGLQATDFSVVEVDESGQVTGNPAAMVAAVEDSRNGPTALTIQLEFLDFRVEPAATRTLEVRVANTSNDANQESNDDGVAVQLREETFLDGSKLTLADLTDAHWVWSDTPGDTAAWRSGVNLELFTGAIVMKE